MVNHLLLQTSHPFFFSVLASVVSCAQPLFHSRTHFKFRIP